MTPLTEAQQGSLLLVDKELGWTSFDVVAKIRNLLKIKKVGHAGTLDPLASGLLVIATGKKTKEINQLMGLPKTYIATIRFGATTASLDSEFPEEQIIPEYLLNTKILEEKLPTFLGEIEQVPPAFSAIHVNGKRAYQLARRGLEVSFVPRKVIIHEIQILSTALNSADIQIACGSGTYIRSLARDLGEVMGVPAYLKKLRRTTIGNFSVENAPKISDWAQHWEKSQ